MTYTYNIIRGVNNLLNDIDNDFFNYSWTSDRKRQSSIKKKEDGSYEAQVELPGYNKESLKIKVENKNLLTVRSAKEDEKDKVLYRLEISNDIDKNNIRAKSVDGILRIVLPQAEEAKVELIKIE
jgi:HSP20 family molecular chaperone IbpA